ncbi:MULTISPECIES: IclR family transcriptional regulator [unclassified Paenibacillus]|uniref:IclR family transcriptional regulator n=1 Tax=unclassified Paenibacillus TaxID=185978 RepID=UPI001AEAEDD3|nr:MULTISPECIES: IclR family transcriptional regulator [unclassified Paenibacillus]MBP1153610.1 DNA-binding IclR family transcriptional regulator [Paenibacillus sp. PvP091]MBP1171005.1 DNA-binding IclR family transcriptional regulator [Paenibacillus sp. PvR098]MBP2442033.1 DNA-binding IclR family transcriptional regulator [Paenibacillus sp. PvP052]
MKNKPFMPVKSADRVFDILEELVKHNDGLHIRELGKKLNIADSSIHALVHTMLQRRYLKMDESRKLFLGSKFYQFSNMMSATPLVPIAKPIMKQIKIKFNENVHLAVLDGLDIVYVAYEESTNPLRYHMEVGRAQSAYVTAVGKMLLSAHSNDQIRMLYAGYTFEKMTPNTITNLDDLIAELERIRERGYSKDDGESYEACICFAAPIYDSTNHMIASMSISIPFVTAQEKREPEMIATIKEATNRVSSLLKDN